MQKITDEKSKLTPIRADDHDQNKPYADGDHRLLTDVASWLLATNTYARLQAQVSSQVYTVDGLLLALSAMRFTDIELAHVRRLLALAYEMVEYEQEDRAKKLEIAAQVGM